MTTNQIILIRSSFAQIAPIADTAAALFYGRLFHLDPALRGMFPTDLKEQGKKLMQMIGAAVGLLDKPGALVAALESLGRRHVNYGVRDEHYATVGSALLWTLEQGLGSSFNAEVRGAWKAMYQVVAETMQRGARSGQMEQRAA
jgi:hemoglobin-like flavoprotein